MRFQLKFLIILILLLLFFPLVKSLTVTCEAGGLYASGSTVIVTGSVNGEASNVTNVTVNINKSGASWASRSTTSDSWGLYYIVFTEAFDIGNYTVSVNASNTTNYATCNDDFNVTPQQPSSACEQKTLTVWGRTMYTAGNLLSSGKVFISIEDTKATNITDFSGSNFTISLTTCLFPSKEYILNLLVIDSSGKKGTTHLSFTPI